MEAVGMMERPMVRPQEVANSADKPKEKSWLRRGIDWVMRRRGLPQAQLVSQEIQVKADEPTAEQKKQQKEEQRKTAQTQQYLLEQEQHKRDVLMAATGQHFVMGDPAEFAEEMEARQVLREEQEKERLRKARLKLAKQSS